MKIAIVGSGIAGNVLAHHLQHEHDLTIFEAGDHIGGHSHTHDVELGGRTYAVDTGFIVFNDWTYPNFIRLLNELDVATQDSTMSFSVRCEATGLEYNGTTINSLFAQRRNLFRPAFWRMVHEILRFNREAPELLRSGDSNLGVIGSEIGLGRYLALRRYSRQFINWYILPMGAAIWSTDPVRMLAFPARCFVQFFHNHGMLSVNRRPSWLTIAGGSREYVRKLTAPFAGRIRLNTAVEKIWRKPGYALVKVQGQEAERFDAVFLACHSDQALSLLADPADLEVATLRAIPYQASEVILHTDASLLPRRRLAVAAWNYHLLPHAPDTAAVTYNMNILQRLDAPVTFCATLNRSDVIRPETILRRIIYQHPVYTPQGLAAQGRQAQLNGANRTYFCGAYWRYGFHEDGVVSALNALEHFRERQARQERRVGGSWKPVLVASPIIAPAV
ncbi:MAG: FAD-dependent oxidoreductase [Steroidobacteraceae bacterium]